MSWPSTTRNWHVWACLAKIANGMRPWIPCLSGLAMPSTIFAACCIRQAIKHLWSSGYDVSLTR